MVSTETSEVENLAAALKHPIIRLLQTGNEPMTRNRTPVIWRLLDGRPGHENQVIGLTNAIERRISSRCCDISVTGTLRGWRCFLLPIRRRLRGLPSPDLLIGAGHQTHPLLLRLQREFGGQTIVVMKPSLPVSLFDLCLIPTHDHVKGQPGNVCRIEGALNRIVPSSRQVPEKGLILIGGPSRHYLWSATGVLSQISEVLSRTPNISWKLASSERTPAEFLAACQKFSPHAELVPFERVDRDWLPQQLAETATVWVTGDSVSMVHEALTSGAAVGILELPSAGPGRVSDSLRQLIHQGWVTPLSHWRNGTELKRPATPVREAERAAESVIHHCLQTMIAGNRTRLPGKYCDRSKSAGIPVESAATLSWGS